MTKHCSVCNAENRDEAQFCRACGTAFLASEHSSFGDEPSTDNICSECGFRNKPGIRYCANCGMNLVEATVELPLGDLAPAPLPDDPFAGFSPPPIEYASFATVAPYPPPPATPPGYPPSLDDTTPLDIPYPDATIAIRRQEARDGTLPAFLESDAAPPRHRATLVVGSVVGVLVVAAVAAWLFLGHESSAPPASVVAPITVPTPPPVPSAAAPVIVEAPPAAPPAASAAMTETAPATPPPATAAAMPPPAAAAPTIAPPPPTAAAPLPNVNDPAPPVETATEAEAKRLAAEKARRDKAARDKADRDAKAKAAAEQRDQAAAAAARAEQEAQAKKRAEDAQRARAAVPAPAPAPTTPASTQARGVRESCAGRGTIAEAVCQSRLCSAAEHANEPICRQLREADERRRNALLN